MDGSGPAEVVVTAAGQRVEIVELVDQYDKEVLVELKGQSFQLGPGQTGGPVPMAPSASGNDVVKLAPVADPTCGVGDADHLFTGGRAYRFTVVTGPGRCQGGYPGPGYTVTAA